MNHPPLLSQIAIGNEPDADVRRETPVSLPAATFCADRQIWIGPHTCAGQYSAMVVVLDPNDVVAHDLRESFHAGGLETLGFTDLLAAGDYMRYKKPDLLVIDPDVADVDGDQLIHFLSKNYGAGLMPMIVQCSDAHPRVAEAVRRLNRGVLVQKSDMNGSELLSIARQLLAQP